MKYLITLLVITLITITGNLAAATLDGDWDTNDKCMGPGDTEPTEVLGSVTIIQYGMFFVTAAGDCAGVIDGKNISMTCAPEGPLPNPDQTGTIFHGELKGNMIIGVNHIPDEGVTCSSYAVRK